MDIYCPKCGEPWEHDSLHDVAQERYGIPYYLQYDKFNRASRTKNPEYNSDDYQKVFREVSQEFQSKGCGVVFGNECERVENDTTAIATAAYEILGDDLDGAASMFEDYGL